MGYRIIQSQEADIQVSTVACASKEKAQENRIYACNGHDGEKKKGSGEYDQDRFKDRWWLRSKSSIPSHGNETVFTELHPDLIHGKNTTRGPVLPISECGWGYEPNRKY
jgi:hypothetical protein